MLQRFFEELSNKLSSHVQVSAQFSIVKVYETQKEAYLVLLQTSHSRYKRVSENRLCRIKSTFIILHIFG